ncbi:MAG: L-idonate 5-dehydrogenase [Albidovulum sp.]|nr:L-idonate 5-dehydrogenase [Albidovulum sp.]MDE0532685.1 L-idonate 5-dehydrogenase [Albidovulum sp.]
MRSVVIHAVKDLRLERSEGVREPGPREALVRIVAGGVCGTDLHYFNHGGFGEVRLKEPMILGHEVAGRIKSIGKDVSGFQPGDLVAVSPSRPCRECCFCLDGMPNQCEYMRFYGSAMPFPHIQGAFRDWIVADADQLVLADGLTAAEAAMAEPLSVCLHAVRQTGGLVGKRVLVTGCGPIGTMMILAARRAGSDEIIATDLSDFPLAKAAEIGADRTVNVMTEPNGLQEYQAGKGRLDVHFECSGAAPALAAGITAIRPGGTVIQLGLGGDMAVPMQALTAKEIALKGSFRFHQEFVSAIGLMQRRLIDVRPLHTHTFELEEFVAAFETAGDRTRATKVQLDFAST